MDIASAAFAQVNIGSAFPPARNLEFQSLGGIVSFFLPKILLLGGIVFAVLMIIAGVGVISSAGSADAHAQEKARNFLTYAIVGLIIIFGAFWILQIINFVTKGALNDILP